MADVRTINGKQVDLDKAAADLKVPKESLTKMNRSMLVAYIENPPAPAPTP